MYDLTSSGLKFVFHPQFSGLIGSLTKGLSAYQLNDHYILLSSGTTNSGNKGYALSRDALLKNAKAVNEHFKLTSQDVWGLSLPDYHVGGLSIYFRAHLLNQEPVDLRPWDPKSWKEKILQNKVTITTVVPTQVYDLVKLKLTSPPTLRFLVVGGDFLATELESAARLLGWPIIRTFGMTEVCSQLASCHQGSKDLDVLPIHKIKVNEEGRLAVKSEALFTLEFKLSDTLTVKGADEFCDEEGFYLTNDRAEIQGSTLRHLGRFDDQVKISGHLVNALTLKDTVATFALKNHIYGQVEISLENDSRKGKKVFLSVLPSVLQDLRNELIENLKPVVVDEIKEVLTFERTDLGKLKKQLI